MHVWNKNKKKEETKRFLQQIRGTKTLTNSNQQGTFNRIGMTSQSYENSQVDTNGITRRVSYPQRPYHDSRNSSPNSNNNISFSSSQNSMYPRQRSSNAIRPSQVMRQQYENYPQRDQRDQRDIDYYDGGSQQMQVFNRQMGPVGQKAANYHQGYYRRETQAQRPLARDPTLQISQRAQMSQISQMQQLQQINQLYQMDQTSQMSRISQVSQQNKDQRFITQNISQPPYYQGLSKQISPPIIYQNPIPQYISQEKPQAKVVYREPQPQISLKSVQKAKQDSAKTQNKKNILRIVQSQQISTNKTPQTSNKKDETHSVFTRQTQYSHPLLTLTNTINQKITSQPFKINKQQKVMLIKVFQQINLVNKVFQQMQKKCQELKGNGKRNKQKFRNKFKYGGKFEEMISRFSQKDRMAIKAGNNILSQLNQTNRQKLNSNRSYISLDKGSSLQQNTVQTQIQI